MIGIPTMSPDRLAEWERACAAGVMLPSTLPPPPARYERKPQRATISRGPLPRGQGKTGEANGIALERGVGITRPCVSSVGRPINIASPSLVADAIRRTNERAAEMAEQRRGNV